MFISSDSADSTGARLAQAVHLQSRAKVGLDRFGPALGVAPALDDQPLPVRLLAYPAGNADADFEIALRQPSCLRPEYRIDVVEFRSFGRCVSELSPRCGNADCRDPEMAVEH